MVNVICAVIAAAATIICAVIAAENRKDGEQRKKQEERQEELARERTKEAYLQLAMIAAISDLTVGVALALKNGRTNGEVETGLAAVRQAKLEYTKYLEELAIDHMN